MSFTDLNRTRRAVNIALLSLFIATAGALLQIGGTSWDITSHLMLKPETFFTPSHTVLYTGVGLLTISAGIGGVVLFENKKGIVGNSNATAFKLLVIGSVISLVAGPSDFLWHETFGVDGLLSPPHLALITGMLINSIAVAVGLARIRYTPLTPSKEKMVRLAMIPAFAALWFTIIWYVYMFSLPFSNGENFQFNPNPILAAIIATILLPLIGSIVFLTASNSIGKFGGATAVAILVVAINTFANLIPADQSMISFLPWYLVMAILPAIIADLVLNYLPKKTIMGTKESQLIACAIIGCVFYVFNYPMIVWVFGTPFSMDFMDMQGIDAIGNLTSDFQASLLSIFAITTVPGALMGVLGGIVASNKICSPTKMIREDARSKNTNQSRGMSYVTDE
ncbi:MAG: hypothetical protein ACRD4Z_03045 [Nitrososphaeraceae archaeon]